MRDSVRAAVPTFLSNFEGVCSYFYLDNHKAEDGTSAPLVTIAIGNLVDPLSDWVLDLPFVHPDGSPCDRQDVGMAWHIVKNHPELAEAGGHAYAKFTSIRLTDEGLATVFRNKLEAVNAQLVKLYPAFESWCSDAQLGEISRAWAAGAYTPAPKFNAAARAGNFEVCAVECGIHTRRDKVNELLFRNAAHIEEAGLDPDVLWFPQIVIAPVVVEGSPADEDQTERT